jgi:hypothetical protein
VSRDRAVGGKHIGGRCRLEDIAAGVGNEPVAVAWLEDAMEHAHAHGQMKALVYLEAVMEDVVFVTEMAATRKPFTVG